MEKSRVCLKLLIFLLCFGSLPYDPPRVYAGETEAKYGFILKANDTEILNVDVEGNVFREAQKIARINSQNTVFDLEHKVIAAFDVDDVVVNSDRVRLAKVSSAGDIDNGSSVVFKWSPNGKLLQGGADTGIEIQPPSNSNFRAASILILLYLSINNNGKVEILQ